MSYAINAPTSLDSTDALSPTGALRTSREEGELRYGWRSRRKEKWRAWLEPKRLLGMMAAVGVVATLAIVATPKAKPAESEVKPSATRLQKIVTSHWACPDEATLDLVNSLLIYQDRKALEALKKAGRITPLKAGQYVHWIGSSGYLGSRVRLKLVDSKTEFWTSSDALH